MKEYCYNKDKNYTFCVSNETLEITPNTFNLNGEIWENDSIQEFYRYISPYEKCNIIDVGAQSGLYSLYAKFLPFSNFYSFEPFKPTYDLLNQNILLNNINNVKTFNQGLSNEKTNIILNTCLSHTGLHTIGSNVLRFNDINPIEISVDTIDNLFFDKNIPVHFIKIDTEGWEYNVLQGALKTIHKYKPIIQLEWNEINMKQCNITPEQLNELIEQFGYIKQKQIDEELFIVPKQIGNLNKYFDSIIIPDNITNIKLDIGLSYSAPNSQNWLSKESNLFVFGFEPNMDSVNNILKGNICKKHENHGQPISNEYINNTFHILPIALFNVLEPTYMQFYSMEKDEGISSLYKPSNDILGPIKEKIQVPVYSLNHFFDMFPWNRFEYIDYIKIDAQGADFDIIKSAGDYLKERVVFITAEPEIYYYEGCNHNTTENMEIYLKSQNFIIINHPNTVDPTFLNLKFAYLYDKIYISQS